LIDNDFQMSILNILCGWLIYTSILTSADISYCLPTNWKQILDITPLRHF